MLFRYFRGLLWAEFAFIAAFFVVIVSFSGSSRLGLDSVAVLVMFGTIAVTPLAVVVGPLLLGLKWLLGGRLATWVAVLLGVLASPLGILAVAFAFREGNETITGMFAFWLRVPGEFVFGVIPHALAGVFFTTAIIKKPIPRRREPAFALRATAGKPANPST